MFCSSHSIYSHKNRTTYKIFLQNSFNPFHLIPLLPKSFKSIFFLIPLNYEEIVKEYQSESTIFFRVLEFRGFFFFFWGVGFNSRDFPLVYFFPTRSLESPSFLFPHFTAIFFLFFWGGAISEFVFALVQKLERK
jgi:hypothetical protein